MLDLVSGVLALLVVLYALAPRPQAVPSEAPVQRLVRAETNAAAPNVPLGVEIVIAGHAHRNWPGCVDDSAVEWTRCETGTVEAVAESSTPIESVAVLALELPGEDLIKVQVTADGETGTCALGIGHAYRARLTKGRPCEGA